MAKCTNPACVELREILKELLGYHMYAMGWAQSEGALDAGEYEYNNELCRRAKSLLGDDE